MMSLEWFKAFLAEFNAPEGSVSAILNKGWEKIEEEQQCKNPPLYLEK